MIDLDYYIEINDKKIIFDAFKLTSNFNILENENKNSALAKKSTSTKSKKKQCKK